jgi:hypothetical protein
MNDGSFFPAIDGSSFGISSVEIATGYELYGVGDGVHFLAGSRDVSLIHYIEAGFWVHPASFPVGNGGSLHRGKAEGLCS